MPLNLKIKLLRDVQAPIRATPGSAGFDLRLPFRVKVLYGGFAQELDEAGNVLREFENGLIPLGFSTGFEKGFAGHIIPRSGLGCKVGLRLRNTSGLIDSDFDLEWMAALRCDMQQASAIIEKNERICQVYFAPVEMPEEMVLEGLDGEISTVPTFFDIAREGGIGSTGTT